MSKGPFRYYLEILRPFAWRLVGGMLVAVAQPFLLLPIPLLVKRMFDDMAAHGDTSRLLLLGAGAAAMNLAYGLVGLWVIHVILTCTKGAVAILRAEALQKLYALPRSFHTRADHGALHTRLVQDTERIDSLSVALLARTIPALLALGVLAMVLLWLNWQLFLAVLGAVPLLLLLDRAIKHRLRARIRTAHAAFEDYSRGVGRVLQLMDLTHLQCAEPYEAGRQREGIDRLRNTSRRMVWLCQAYDLIQNMVVAVGGVVIVMLGSVTVTGGRMSLGDLIAFYLTFGLAQTQVRKIVNVIAPILEGREAVRRVVELLRADDPRPYAGTRRPESFRGHIVLDRVGFRYDGEPLLRNASMEVRPGTRVAVMGPNGCGKSTIIHLILGFYRPQEGRLLADGQPYDEVDVAHLRRSFGVVPQDPVLFTGTIAENIAYGSPDANRAQIEAAAEAAAAHGFIIDLPDGYGTRVGERGVRLSGGQRQRIAIARALLRRPSFLILDEPTNHLDRDAVTRLLDQLADGAAAPTVLLVSHDPKIVSAAADVYLMADGRLQRQGSLTQPLRPVHGVVESP